MSTPYFEIDSSTFSGRLLKNGHLLRSPHLSSLRRTGKYASLLKISGALHLVLFEQPGKDDVFSSLLDFKGRLPIPKDEVFSNRRI
jgi:hypothetical protein